MTVIHCGCFLLTFEQKVTPQAPFPGQFQSDKTIFPALKYIFNLGIFLTLFFFFRNMWNSRSIHETCLPHQNFPQPLLTGYGKAQER